MRSRTVRTRALALAVVFAGAGLAAACGLSLVGAALDGQDAGAEDRDGGGSPTRPPPDGAGEVEADAPATCEPSPTNPRACGRCGRDCGRGECRAGVCMPYPIAEGIPAPWYIAVDESRVFVTSHVYQSAGSGAVYAFSKNGGEPPVAITEPRDSFDVLVLGADLVVSSIDDRTLFMLPKNGREARREVWDGGGATLDLATRDGGVYFTSRGPLDHGVRAMAEGTLGHLVSLDAGREVEGIAVDATHVYWANRGGPGAGGSIGRALRDGGERNDDWHPAPRVRRLTVDDEAVYWTSDTDAVRTPKDGGSDVKLVGDVRWGTIVVDATYAYITVDRAGLVVRVNKRDGSDLVQLATGLSRPMGLTDDGTSIYFTERDRGRVWRATK
ncbi:MAG: hypothetical protein KIT84_01395 [Labilithrix sp.]|nr:hypothetical protein [Labilithrix sp.]MCW5809641.1 hypothetical protein [Labilithrix sp.]